MGNQNSDVPKIFMKYASLFLESTVDFVGTLIEQSTSHFAEPTSKWVNNLNGCEILNCYLLCSIFLR